MKLGIPAILGLIAISAAAPVMMAQNARRVIVQRSGTSYLGLGAIEVTPERAKALQDAGK